MNSQTSLPAIRCSFLVLAAVLICFATIANGQSAYFNAPTSDVMPENELYLEAAFDAKLSRFRDGGWQSFGFSGLYGVRKRMEIGLNGYFVRTSGGFEPAELQPNVKFQLHHSEDNGTSLAAGGIAYVAMKKNSAKDIVSSVYVVGGKRFKREWTPKFTAGAYQLIGGRDVGGRRGFLFAVEQPLHSRVSLIADWNSGKNRFGYSAAGVGITLTRRSYLYSAYYFGNEGRGNNFLGVYYGFSL